MSSNIIALVFGLLTVAIIGQLLRQSRMREKYATLWMLVSLVVLILAIFPDLLTWVANQMGVTVPLNLLYFLGGIAALLICVQFSVELSRLEERTRVLAEKVALLRAHLDAHQRADGPNAGG